MPMPAHRPDPADGAFSPPAEYGPRVDGAHPEPGATGAPPGQEVRPSSPEPIGRPPAAAAGPSVPLAAMDRLSRHLSMAAFRLAGLRRRVAEPPESLILNAATDELDEAIAEIRRLALIARRGPGA